MRSLLTIILTGLFLTGCGVIYISPTVQDGKTDAGVNVDVVSLNFNSADFANRLVPYKPRPLPAPLKMFGSPNVAPVDTSLEQTLSEERREQLRSRWPDPLPVQSYRLGVGDLLLFSPPSATSNAIPGLAQAGLDAASARRQSYAVQDDGSISIPDIGRIRVVGLTMPQVEQAIFEALLERQKDPSFSVEVAEFNSRRVDIAGLVSQPASLPITLKPLYLREALSAVGGTRVSNIDDVFVTLNRDGDTYEMLLTDVYSDTTLGRQILKDGDSIFVDTLFNEDRARAYLDQQVTLRQQGLAQQQLALSEFQLQNAGRQADRNAVLDQLTLGAYQQDHVYVVGEVKKQSRFTLPFAVKANLADVLYNEEAGGFDLKTANVGQVYVLRHSKLSGRITAYHLDASNVASMVVATQLEMRPDDFVFVAEQRVTRWNRVIQQLVPSLFISLAANASN